MIIIRRTQLISNIRRLFTVRHIDYNCTPAGSKLTAQRQQYLDGLAAQLYSDIYNTPYTGHNCTLYDTVNALCDEEVAYIGKHYRTELTRGNSLVSDMSTQWTVLCDFDSLTAHLQKVGEI